MLIKREVKDLMCLGYKKQGGEQAPTVFDFRWRYRFVGCFRLLCNTALRSSTFWI